MRSHAGFAAVLLAFVLLLSSVAGCTPSATETDADATPEPSASASACDNTPQSTDAQAGGVPDATSEQNTAKPTIAFIITDDGALLTRCAMHGFLRTAENLNYPARLYKAESGASPEELIDKAVADGCSGFVIWADSAEMDSAVKYAKQQGLPVVAAMASGEMDSSVSMADSVLSSDPDDYCAEAVRIMCEAAISRGNKDGTIIIARQEGADQYIVDAFQKAINESYPAYTLTDMPIASSVSETEAAAKEYLKDEDHRKIAGVLALSPGASTAWYNAEIAAEKAYSFKISPVIMALDYTEENLSLVSNSKILCLIARPYYTCAAQATMVLDSLLNGSDVQAEIRVNAPIIKRKDVEKYASIVSEVKTWFGM